MAQNTLLAAALGRRYGLVISGTRSSLAIPFVGLAVYLGAVPEYKSHFYDSRSVDRQFCISELHDNRQQQSSDPGVCWSGIRSKRRFFPDQAKQPTTGLSPDERQAFRNRRD